MSQDTKDRWDYALKIILGVIITAAGFFFNRMANEFDRVQSSIENIGARVGVIESEIKTVKEQARETQADLKYLQRKQQR